MRRPDLRPIAAALVALVTVACIPARITYLDSPTLDGTFRAASGAPIAGARVAVSSEYDDTNCRKAKAEVLTDDAGRFRLPETKHVERWLILLPIDRIASYMVCIGHDTLWAVYRSARLGYHAGPSQPLECFEWGEGEKLRASCRETGSAYDVSGGEWSTDSLSGHFRFVNFLDPLDRTRHSVLAQWVVGPKQRTPGAIAATVDLGLATGVHGLQQPEIHLQDGRWRVHLKGSRRGDLSFVRDVVVELRLPGELRLVSDECDTNLLRDLWLMTRTCK